MCSSRGFPSLATVADRFRPRFGKNRDCRKVLDSDLDSALGVGGPSRLLLLPRLVMRKKFLNLVGRWVLESVGCFLVKERPEKVRFSVVMLSEGEGESERESEGLGVG